jgi:radical SAM protein with 4Fe4S-binding SPASM domain
MRYPTKINFESSTACNARCTFCPRYDMTRLMGSMSDTLFYKIIKDGKDMGVKQYSPFLMGEPFVFPKIWEWLDYMEKEEVEVSLYTNGIYVDIDKLNRYKNIRYLNFSINAATDETHTKVMRGPKFDVAKKKFEYALKTAKFPVRASFVVIEENVHEVETFKSMFKKTEVTGFANWTGDRQSALARKGEKVPCWVLFHQMVVLWNGTVVPCCMDYDGKQVLGDANTQTLKEIWHNSSWMRTKHANYDFGTYVCRNCNYNVKPKL